MKKIIFILLCIAGANASNAQDIGQILAGSKPDANKYLSSYLEPFGKGEIMNMGRGWFNTARVHKKLGFDLTISAQLAIVPSSSQNFTFNNADYASFKLKSGAASATIPTFIGDAAQQTLSVNTTVDGKNVSYEFATPKGIGKDFKDNVGFVAVPLPVAQLGVGIFKNTELKVRYFPKTSFSGTQVGVFGLAVQNEIGNYIPVFKRLPFLHLSALAGYNTVNVDYDLTGKGTAGSNQHAVLKINAFTLQAIGSVKLAFLEIYTSLGYTTGKSNANLNGSYIINYTDKATGLAYSTTVVDPIALSYNQSGVTNTWGARVNVFFLKFFADYTFAPTYNGAGAGLAFSFR